VIFHLFIDLSRRLILEAVLFSLSFPSCCAATLRRK